MKEERRRREISISFFRKWVFHYENRKLCKIEIINCQTVNIYSFPILFNNGIQLFQMNHFESSKWNTTNEKKKLLKKKNFCNINWTSWRYWCTIIGYNHSNRTVLLFSQILHENHELNDSNTNKMIVCICWKNRR